VGSGQNLDLDDLLRAAGIGLPERPAPRASEQPNEDQKCLRAMDVVMGVSLATGHHEAGHVLVGVYLGRKLRSGVRIGKRTEVRFYDRRDRGDEDLEARVKIAIAGPIAEAAFAGHSAGFASDLKQARRYLRKLDADEESRVARLTRLSAQVREILDAAPVAELAWGIVGGKGRTKKRLGAELCKLGWGRCVDIAIDDGTRRLQFLEQAAPGLNLCPPLERLVGRFVAALPPDPRVWLFRRGSVVRFVGRDDVAYVSLIRSPASPCFIVALRADIVGLPEPQAFAIVAHELGHVRHRYRAGRETDAGTPGEIQADSFALECGFANGLRAHLDGQQAGAGEVLGGQLRERIAAIDTFLDRRGNGTSGFQVG
jgi:hypothetical protein